MARNPNVHPLAPEDISTLQDQAQQVNCQTLSDEQKVLGEVGQTDSGTLCGDASTVAGDASTVHGDFSTMQGDQSRA